LAYRRPFPGTAPLREDWVAARIIPFAAFLGAALLLSTFTTTPELWYPIKVAFMAGALAFFLPLYRSQIIWQFEPLAMVAGVAIGILWLALSPDRYAEDGPLDAALAALPAGILAVWILLRMAGTIILVPVVEELFFRGYVLDRLDRGGMGMRIVALSVSTALFAALHDRWALAAVAGVGYAVLYLRKRQIADAVAAHVASNAVTALYALATARWSLI
jgi:CAAX protease family protein